MGKIWPLTLPPFSRKRQQVSTFQRKVVAFLPTPPSPCVTAWLPLTAETLSSALQSNFESPLSALAAPGVITFLFFLLEIDLEKFLNREKPILLLALSTQDNFSLSFSCQAPATPTPPLPLLKSGLRHRALFSNTACDRSYLHRHFFYQDKKIIH